MIPKPSDEEMKSRYWEKLWHEIIDDYKLWPLSADLKWRFVTLIIMAGKQREGGLLPGIETMAYMLRAEGVTVQQLQIELPALAQRELVELVNHNGQDRWFLSNYEKRQAAVTDAERQRRSREFSATATYKNSEKEEDKAAEVTDICHDTVTNRDNDVTHQLLTAAGIARNRTTAPLWSLDPDYVRAHIEASKTAALAIRKMLDHDPPPRRKTIDLHNQIPPGLEDVIKR